MLRLKFANGLYLLLVLTGADLEQEHNENFPLLICIQLCLPQLGFEIISVGLLSNLWNVRRLLSFMLFTVVFRLFFCH